MSDEITVHGGGIVRVATEEVSRHAAQLREFADACDRSRMRLGNVTLLLSAERLIKVDAPISAEGAHDAIESCVTRLGLAAFTARSLAFRLDVATNTYSAAEHFNRQLLESAGGMVAYGLGGFARLFGGSFAPVLAQFAGGAIGAAAAWLLTPEERRTAAREGVAKLGAVLSDPGFVTMARLSASSLDELGAGALLVPWPVLGLLGDEALGILGYSAAAGAITATARGLGVARETPVRVMPVGETKRVDAPAGVGELVARIPEGTEQVRVDTATMADGTVEYLVYVGGTRDGPEGPPWDMTSNLSALADGSVVNMGDAGSTRAVMRALDAAGAEPGDAVRLAGHSQGAAVATQVANTGVYSVRSIVSVGGPIGELDVPEGTRVLAIEHPEDIVLAAGGVHRNPDTIVVERRLFEDGEVPVSSLLPAHELARYRETAVMVDELHDSRVVAFREEFTAAMQHAVAVESQLYVGTRVDR